MQGLIALAVLPGLLLMLYVYKLDKIEKEPAGLLLKLFIFGALTTVTATILELIGDAILGMICVEGTVGYLAIDCFLIVALSEELGKYFVLKKVTWKHPAFNYQFDAIVYSVCASLGFAVLENILYVIDGGFSTALLRAITSIPGHAINGVFMGYYYGRAKLFEQQGDLHQKKNELRKALIVPILLHGFYDFGCMSDSTLMLVLFVIFIVVLDIIAFVKIRKFSKADVRIVQEAAAEEYSEGIAAEMPEEMSEEMPDEM